MGKRHSPEQIIRKLRQAENRLASGSTRHSRNLSRLSHLQNPLLCRLPDPVLKALPDPTQLRGSVNRRVAYVSRHDGKAVESL